MAPRISRNPTIRSLVTLVAMAVGQLVLKIARCVGHVLRVCSLRRYRTAAVVIGEARPDMMGYREAILFKKPNLPERVTLFKERITSYRKPGFFKSRLFKVLAAAVVMILGLLVLLVPTWAGTDFVVNSTADGSDANLQDNVCDSNASTAGQQCTLRAAIEQANATANGLLGPDAIKFNISGTGVHKIAPTSRLPGLGDPVVIDGYTQPGASANTLEEGNNARLLIELDGSGTGSEGLVLLAPNSTVRGLVINNFSSAGITFAYGSGGNTVEGNFIGTDATGTNDLGNGGEGVFVQGASNNTIGGKAPQARNVISGNDSGVFIFEYFGRVNGEARANKVQGNYIGTDATGTRDLGNSNYGVQVNGAPDNTIGGTTAGEGNVISGNDGQGVIVQMPDGRSTGDASGNLVEGNYIGTDATGTNDLGNSFSGVRIENAPANTVGGTSQGARNVISGNDNAGVFLDGSGATGNEVEGNYIGTDATGTNDLGNSRQGVWVNGAPANTIGGTSQGARNVISGNDNSGVLLVGSGATGNEVEGNYIGTDATGTRDLGNFRYGVDISAAPTNTIGGTGPGARNVISGNNQHGVAIYQSGASGNKVQGNYIGTDATGKVDLGNSFSGVWVQEPANTVGGTAAGARNVISGNGNRGVEVFGADATGTLIQGNYIGTDATGTADLGNSDVGLVIDEAPNNTVGGAASGARNVISGNDSAGVHVFGTNATGNNLQGNYVGTDVSGTQDLGNGNYGVYLNAAPKNAVGGTMAGEGNVISGNASHGVLVSGGNASGNTVEGNHIGTDATGAKDLGNSGFGVRVENGAANNTIGGTTASGGNVIAYNDSDGVGVVGSTTTTDNAILSNSIFSNDGLGIDLADDGVSANDAGDADTGPNDLQNFPELSSAVLSEGETTIEGTLDSTSGSSFVVQFFSSPDKDPSGHGEGKKFLGQLSGSTDPSGKADISFATQGVSAGELVSATASSGERTSEFSNAVAVNDLIVTNTKDSGAGSLRQAIVDANTNSGTDTIDFNIPTTDSGYNSASGVWTIRPASALPNITGPLTIDGYSQPGASENTLKEGNDAKLLIGLDGANAGTSVNGLVLDTSNSTIRGLVIHNFSQNGIAIWSGRSGNTIQGNYIGTDASGTRDLGNSVQGVRIENAPGNTVGGTEPGARNIISGNDDAGVYITDSGASGNKVQGNYIGTDATGTKELGNSLVGVYINEASANTIGGVLPGARNIISGNEASGVVIVGGGASANKIQGNYVGTDASGTQDLGNDFTGVGLIEAPSNTIGGASGGARNVISGNDNYGVQLALSGTTDNHVRGNYVGTDVTGTRDLGNGNGGVYLNAAPNNTIGGTMPGEGNVISGNARDGLKISGGSSAGGNKIQGNYIGTDATGTKDLGNSFLGVWNMGADTTIGGTEPGARNIISGNDTDGIAIDGSNASGNLVQGNYIGTDATGAKDLGNSFSGVILINGATGNTIGGSTASEGNVIAFNDSDGVTVVGSTGTGNSILSNSIFSNDGLGIDLADDGVSANDAGDADTGPNDLQNFPELSSFATSNGTTTIEGTLESTPGSTFTVQFFSSSLKDASGHGEGKNYLGQQSVTTDASGKADLSVATTQVSAREFVSATATTASNPASTSEFSNAVVLNSLPQAGSQSLTTGEDTAKEITLSATDAEGDKLAFEITDQPDHGALGSIETVRCEAATKSCEADLTYTPNKDYSGSDSFKFLANDGIGDSSEATVSIEVSPVNDAPVANDDAYSVMEGETLIADVLANDSDADNDALRASVVQEPAHGKLTPNENGSFEYVPNAGFKGSDSFTYMASDTTTNSNTATVTVTVKEVNQISLSGATLTEGDSGSSVEALIEVRLSRPAEGEVQVFVATEDDTALSSQDYEATSGILTFSEGETAFTLAVPIKGDALDEPTESFFVNLSDAVGGRITDARAAVTIQDDDAAPSLSIDDTAVSEPAAGSAKATFDVKLAAESGRLISVDYATSDGTATAASGDYSETSGTLYFPAGTTSKSVTVPVNADTQSESEEDFFLRLPAAQNATIADNEGRATVMDTPPAVELALSVSGSRVTEGNSGTSEALFEVRLSRPASEDVTVDFATEDDTASSQGPTPDYDATSGTLTFTAGETSKTVAIAVRGDALDELTESFFLNLSNPKGAPIADATAAGIIRDDDDPPSLAVDDVTVSEPISGTASATFDVSLSAPSGRPISVDYSTADGSATVTEGDYSHTSGTVYFKPGITERTVSVAVRADTKSETEEDFFLTLFAPENASVSDEEGRATIEDSVPTILRVRPGEGATGVSPRADVVALFSKEIDPSSLNSLTFELRKAGSTKVVAAAVSYEADYRRAILDPQGRLARGATYEAVVRGGPEGVRDLFGRTLEADKVWSFQVRK